MSGEVLDATKVDAPWPQDFTGWQRLRFVGRIVKPKADGAWFCLKFAGDWGDNASWDGNLFTQNLTDGRKTANKITMGALAHLFRAFGLAETDFPQPSVAEIDKALMAFEGEAVVSGRISKDDKGYNQVTDFRKFSGETSGAKNI